MADSVESKVKDIIINELGVEPEKVTLDAVRGYAHSALDAVIDRSSGLEGDVYTLERDRTGRHGSIMHYNLNAGKK